MAKRKRRTTKKKAEPKKVVDNTFDCIVLDRHDMKRAIRGRYKYYDYKESKEVDLIADPRPVYIEERNGNWRFWGAINAKKGIMSDPGLPDLSKRRG